MGFFSNLRNKNKTGCASDTFECDFVEQELIYKRLALEVVIDLIGNSIARADWKQFESGKEIQSKLYYRLNVAPNETQTSSEFFKKFTKRLLLDGEVLIVPDLVDGNLYVADSFMKQPLSYKSDKFTNVFINDCQLNKTFTNETAIYLRYNEQNIRNFMESYITAYNKLLESAVYSYQSNKTRRFVLDSKMFRAQTTEAQADFNNQMAQNLADFASSTSGSKIYAKSNDWEIQDMSDKQIESANDSRNFIKDMFDIVATTYHVPIQMVMSSWVGTEVTQNVIDNYLVQAVYPLIDMFKEGLNRFNYSEQAFLNGDKIETDLTKVRLTDLKTIGTFIAQVFPTGALSLNDIVVKYLHGDKLPDEIGDTRVITKNYQKIEDFNSGVEPETEYDPAIEPVIETEEN